MIVFARQIKKKKKEDCSEKNKNEMIMNTANICSEYCWYAAKTCKNNSHCRTKKKKKKTIPFSMNKKEQPEEEQE